MSGRVTLGLVDEANQFQQLLRSDAEAVARRTGLVLTRSSRGTTSTIRRATLRRLFSDPAPVPTGSW